MNENSNRLLRQYFPKAMELADVTKEQVQKAVERLTPPSPRKVLGYSPYEVFFGMTVRYTMPPAEGLHFEFESAKLLTYLNPAEA